MGVGVSVPRSLSDTLPIISQQWVTVLASIGMTWVPPQPTGFLDALLVSSWVVACVSHHHFSRLPVTVMLGSALMVALFVMFPRQWPFSTFTFTAAEFALLMNYRQEFKLFWSTGISLAFPPICRWISRWKAQMPRTSVNRDRQMSKTPTFHLRFSTG